MYAKRCAITDNTKNTRAPSITCLCNSSDSAIVRPVGQTLLGSSIVLVVVLMVTPFSALEGCVLTPARGLVLCLRTLSARRTLVHASYASVQSLPQIDEATYGECHI